MSGTTALRIPGLFLTCVRYFELIQVARNPDSEIASCDLQLRGTELRLRRWGRAAGITDSASPELMTALEGFQEDEIKFAHDALEQIEAQLENAQRRSKPLIEGGSSLSSTPTATEHINDAQHTQEDFNESELDRALNKLRAQYGKSLRFGEDSQKKTKWALHDSTMLKNLISTTSAHLADLEKLFTKDIDRLVSTEVAEMMNLPDQGLALYLKVMAAIDPPLQQASKPKLASSGRTYQDIDADGEANSHIGRRLKEASERDGQGDVFQRMKFGGKSKSHVGDSVGYDEK
ncbi:Heterokaryon incompatibility protein S [Fulvia fulva]|uniref:Heterokaryon incompatibility protein S n=1 Tax=Passalora fulva TaxID=5499 RepID=A0A9Q8LF55_PASFU|nr:Heterokaryon incompatibility protein S [Fulvia fulva]KAK4627085.1 Heterokaryon incompatibility protein S [Fulvia fulva]KAK4628036.1 Heterokaryon incompatibility protein S [Fulvia fulva]UJO16257.1 Heterokaryon incompatibility protein S [Fulvia fulva]WPV14371.1 Heterokaryon incompatibility protein S [Fulvia fulva]WPV29062.1 Heterokaryon incompatibility protein S [Fulvia fulva]